MGILAAIVVSGLVGVVGHWLTRYVQGRTESSFKDYVMEYKAKSLQSVMANLTSSFTIYSTIPDDIHGKPLVMILIGAYMAGYTLDSSLNKDAGVQVKTQRAGKDEKKSVDDLLAGDR